jgi:hypothetical protein
MTQVEIEAQKNSLLASGQPITAATHRNWAQQTINEMYNAASRGRVLATVGTIASLTDGDEVFVVRAGELKRIDRAVFAGTNGGTP